MPVGDLPGWHQSYRQDFTTPAAVGSVASVYGADMAGYSGFSDTSGHGIYAPSTVLSVSDGVLDWNLHTLDGRPQVATPIPMGYAGQLYGRYSVRLRTDTAAGYKIAFLLWPTSNNWNDGEIDWPETPGHIGDTARPASLIVGSPGPAYNTAQFQPAVACYAATTTNGWHIATTEWTPQAVTWFWDGQLVGHTDSVAAVPTTKMRWTLQVETSTDGTVPSPSTTAHVQVDWLSAWTYQP